MSEPLSPQTQVHIANEMLITALGPHRDSIAYTEARKWLDVLHGYAKAGVEIPLVLGRESADGDQANIVDLR
ncbi:hypothetical protein SAMN05660733_02520 [Lentzea albidocapillata]|uniref:Uncharacterized protein n=1 Tax=Lentzea albidocapillata TaxID=40571 RepID=A0A1W2CY98_9PSEU|nr:hypothetical protein SAMN05660733_02520 [Lentzea albidocapillata]